jgi:crotonobetainyl-CoA:carnitine CoA-transferase CaiB-like acyl-CoA transferase
MRPDVVYVHCVGFGSDGPYADLQAYEDIIQAATGTASLAIDLKLTRAIRNDKDRI